MNMANNTDSDTTFAARRLQDLPGPPGVPWLGNALQVRRSRIHLDLERWALEYGPLFRVKLGRFNTLVVADSNIAASILRERPERFRRPHRSSDAGREMGFQPGVFSAEGEAWRAQRRMVMSSFSPGHVRAYFPSLLKVTRRLHGRWLAAVRAGRLIDLQPELMRFTVDAISGLAFGADVNTLESDDDVIQRHLDKVFPALFRRIFALVPWWRIMPSKADRELDHAVREINAAIDGFILGARERMLANPALREQPNNLLEAMIAAADAPDSGVSDKDVAGNVLTMLLAGEDTTANTLAWLIYLLHKHPQAMVRARHEVRSLGVEPGDFTLEQMASFDFLEACALETMRLKPVAPNLPVEALVDTEVAGIAVPAGTLVWSLLRHDTMKDEHFPQAREFHPERWLAHGSPEQPVSAKRMAMPFGSGPRICPGRYLALLEIKMAMAMLIACFDIESVDTPHGNEPREMMAFTMHPVGLRMRLRER